MEKNNFTQINQSLPKLREKKDKKKTTMKRARFSLECDKQLHTGCRFKSFNHWIL